tara:strand:- start:251 stop:676 length:426 start_codon:yes stop_codon:yes gene_type:complete
MTNPQSNRHKPIRTKESNLFDLNIGCYIKQKRHEYKKSDNRGISRLTQAELGKVLNVTFQQIQKYEKGQNSVPVWKLYQLSQYLKFDIGHAIVSSANNEHYPKYLVQNKVIQVSYQQIAKEETIPLSAKYWIEKMETNKNK